MTRDLRRGRLPQEPHGFALFVVIVLAIGAALVLTLPPRVDGWVTQRIDQRLPR